MRTGIAAAETWRSRFDRIDRAPWPGPRPIREDPGKRLLHGRGIDGDRFLAAVIDHLLVVLTADSGVGKSSLLNGRLRPDLQSEGFRVVYIDKWHFREGETPGEFVGQKVAEQLGDPDLTDASADGFWGEVDTAYGDRLVIVLDQFEELVRFRAGVFRRTRDWLATLNRMYRIRVVISLRAEYQHQLRQLEHDARPFTMTTQRLEPVTEEKDIRGLIESPDVKVGAIEPKAIDTIVGIWIGAQDTDDRPGLLHLQGLLYVLYHRAQVRASSSVKEADVLDLCREAEAANVPVFEHGLQAAVVTKLEHCRTAARGVGLDRILVDGTDAIVRRIAPHLSSGGFKLVLDEWTVATLALRTQIERVTSAASVDPKELYEQVKTVCFTEDDQIRAEAWPPGFLDQRERWTFGPRTVSILRAPTDDGGEPVHEQNTYHLPGWAPWYHDPRDVSSGPMLGMPPDTVMFQELRRFAFALAWLQEASLVRRSMPEPGRTMVALIHDGFGAALERYADETSETFAHAMARLTGARGDELHWSAKSIREFCATFGGDAPHPLTNLRWRDCSITDVEFAGLVFVNGDFRGTRFERCAFDGVSFVNCLLDNAVFSECQVRGRTSTDDLEELVVDEITAGGDRRMPDFLVAAPRDEIELLERYRGIEPTSATDLYSRTSGIAAHPAHPGHPPGLVFRPADRGLAVYGGRLNSLMLNGCIFETVKVGDATDEEPATRPEGTLALRHIAGAALDLAEYVGGRLEIFDSTIRGLTVTAPEPGSGPLSGATEIEVVSAIMANVWFDADVRGSAHFRDTIVTQVVSCSPPDQFRVEIDTVTERNVPVGIIGDVGALDERFSDALAELPGAHRVSPPLTAFAAMDYRSRPAESELGGVLSGKPNDKPTG